MKKHTERQPIDDLFARKLENISLPLASDGFDRLQARMRQSKSEVRVVFWRNPTVQRMAYAACLLVVFLFSWLNWPSGKQITPTHPQVAVNQNTPLRSDKSIDEQPDQLAAETTPIDVAQVKPGHEQLAQIEKKSERSKPISYSASRPVNINNVTAKQRHSVISERSEFIVVQTKNTDDKANPETTAIIDIAPAKPLAPEQVAVVEKKATSASEPTAERVLVVTIDEPATLVAARQAAKASVDGKASAAAIDKAEKEPKHGGLWQQVKRLKEGEVFARRDNADDDERGLLSRAYNGLKHSLDKDKSTKQ